MDFIQSTITTFAKQRDLAERAYKQISWNQARESLSSETNSIAVIMKHVAGNLKSRWTDFLGSDGEKPWRDRDTEFVDDFKDLAALEAFWNEGWQRLFETLESLSEEDLGKTVTIRGEEHSVYLAIQRSLAHTGYHVGQIVQVARVLAGENWTTLTIPRGASERYNADNWKK